VIFGSVPHWRALELANSGLDLVAKLICGERASEANLSQGLERLLAAPHRAPCLLGEGPDRIPATWIHIEGGVDPIGFEFLPPVLRGIHHAEVIGREIVVVERARATVIVDGNPLDEIKLMKNVLVTIRDGVPGFDPMGATVPRVEEVGRSY
jgi:hypothetical protein